MQKDQILSSILLLFLLIAAIGTMVDSQPSIEAKVHIVYTEKPEDLEAEEYHIKTLASVLGRFELFFNSVLFPVLNFNLEIWGCGFGWYLD